MTSVPGWKPSDSIAIAAIAAGLFGTLLGVFLGGRVSRKQNEATRAYEAAKQSRFELIQALAKADKAIALMSNRTLAETLLEDQIACEDRTDEALEALDEEVAQTREALALVAVAHPDSAVQEAARHLIDSVHHMRRHARLFLTERGKGEKGTRALNRLDAEGQVAARLRSQLGEALDAPAVSGGGRGVLQRRPPRCVWVSGLVVVALVTLLALSDVRR